MMPSFFSMELLAVGLPVGALAGMLGVGGGVILVPTLNLLGIPMHTAIGISLSYAVFTSASGVFRHIRQRTVDPILALPIIVSAAITVQAGAHFSNLLSESTLRVPFAFLLFLVATSFAMKDRKNLSEGEESSFSEGKNKIYIIIRENKWGEGGFYKFNVFVGGLIGGPAGFISGMFGVGGGFVTTPLMVMMMSIPIHIAVGTSLLGVFFTSTIGSITHWKLGNVDFAILIPLTMAGIVGAQIGARLMLHLPQQKLRAIFNTLLIVMSFYMFAKGIGYL